MRLAASLAVGLFFGFVGAMLQTYVVLVGSTSVPVGALLVLVALVPVARACAWWVGSRWGASAFAVGWLASTLLLATTSGNGDLVITDGTRQLVYLVVGAMVLAAACGFPLLPADDPPVDPSENPLDGAGSPTHAPDDV